LSILTTQIKVSKAAVFQRQSRQNRVFLLTNWLDVEHFPSRSRFEEDSDVIKNLAENKSAVPVNEIIAATSDKYEKIFLQFFENGLVIPLRSGWGMNGILFIGPKIDHTEITDDDREFLFLLGGQMAVALENARLYEAEKRAIADLQATQEQMVHTERLAALGEMSAKIAHEINNPLGIIKNYLMLLKKANRDKEDSFKYVEIVGQEIDRITGIVKELLQFHRPRHVDHRKINVLNVIEEVATFLSPQFDQAKIKCTRKFSIHSPEIEGSPENLKQVFINILLNAIDAMPGGGEILILSNRRDGHLALEFHDTGSGVKEEQISKIFEPFYTTKEEGKGTGLGLAVSYGIIKKHHGSIAFKNTDRGGCVEIILPAAKK